MSRRQQKSEASGGRTPGAKEASIAEGDVRKKSVARKIHRGTQVIFGERQRLREVLGSIRRAPSRRRGTGWGGRTHTRRRAETKSLEKLIQARTEELNNINPAWDRKFEKARNAQTSPQELLHLASALPADDYLLARTLAEHPEAPPELLGQLAGHPYSAVRENVARHPRSHCKTLDNGLKP